MSKIFLQYKDHVSKYLLGEIKYFPVSETDTINITRPKIILTVDIEALCARAENNHFDKLIWGNFGGTNLGIGKMMDIAEKYGVSLTCFLDLCGYERYGQRLIDTAKIIIDRGHDLQLHAHPSQIPIDVWKNYGLKRQPNLFTGDLKSIDALFKYIFDIYSKIGTSNLPIKDPVAFRGASFGCNKNVLDQMQKYAIKISSNYNPWSSRQINNENIYGQFKWNNGIIEIPISTIAKIWGYQMFNFEIYDFMPLPRLDMGMRKFYRLLGNSAILVFVLHSWSFLKELESGFFAPENAEKKIALFDALISRLKVKYDIVTISEIAGMDNRSALPLAGVRDSALVDYHNTKKQK